MSKHRNSLDNPNVHHLYQIKDTEEKTIFKSGISDDLDVLSRTDGCSF